MQMRRVFRLFLLTTFVLVLAPMVFADTITVTSAGVVGNVWSYTIAEDASGTINAGAPPGPVTNFNSPGTATADYFTVFDFVGFTGTVTTPPGWAFQSAMVGSRPDTQNVPD